MKEEITGIKIHIDPDDPWAGLIDPDGLPPAGMFQMFTGGKTTVAEKVN
jgi:hypothetical protein